MGRYHRRAVLAAVGTVAAGCSAPTRDRDSTRPTSPQKKPQTKWTTGGYDIANTGHIPIRASFADVDEAWRIRLDNRSDILAAPVLDDRVYAGSGQTIYAISLKDGSKLWQTETNHDTGIVSATIANGTLVMTGLGVDGGRLFGIDSETGRIEWSHTGAVSTAPKVANGRVYVGTSDPERPLVALEASSGEVAWSVSFGPGQSVDALRSAPAIHGDTVFLAVAEDGTEPVTVLYAVSTDGEEQWGFEAPGVTNAAPAVDEGSIYFGTTDGTVYAVETTSGEQRWNRAVSGKVYSSPAIDPEQLYLGTLNGHLYALTKESGEKRWHRRERILYTDPVVTAETVYTGGELIRAHDAETGDVRWQFDMDSKAHAEFTSPAVIPAGMLFGACSKKAISQPQYGNYVLMLRNSTR